MEHCEIFIVGAGAAGMAAAVSAWNAGCRSILLADRGQGPGGVLSQCLHHGFGLAAFGRELTGPDYAHRLAGSLEGTGVQVLYDTEVFSVKADRTALLSSRRGVTELRFDRLILAAGCREKAIGSLPVAGTRPAGIFTAGQAQELINLRRQDIGDNILILGSGDLGMIMARRLVLEGKKVVAVLEQNESYGGMARNYRRCIEQYRIPLLCRRTVTEIFGEGRICGVTVEHLDSGAQEYVPCGTLVTALGLIPDRELVRSLGQRDWLWLAGNCDRVYALADSAVAQAVEAGRQAAEGWPFPGRLM